MRSRSNSPSAIAMAALCAGWLLASCVDKGDTNLSTAEGNRERDFTDSVCGRSCNKQDEANCPVSPDCEVQCINLLEAVEGSTCGRLFEEYTECIADREIAECSVSTGQVRDQICLDELAAVQSCFDPGFGFCNQTDDPDPCVTCGDENCCLLQFECQGQEECDFAFLDWSDCLERALVIEDVEACNQAFSSAGGLATEYLECMNGCWEACGAFQ